MDQADFVARGPGYTLFLTPTEVGLSLRGGSEDSGEVRVQLGLRMLGANLEARMRGLDLQPGQSHYMMGTDPALWRTEVANFGKVSCTDVYPGVDVVYYGNPHELEFDFVVAQGASASAVRFEVVGAERVALERDGRLRIDTMAGPVRLRAPRAFQGSAASHCDVEAGYVVQETDGVIEVGFELGAYDRSLPLVIDPVVDYATFLGGSGFDGVSGIAVDTLGNAYLVGETTSLDYPAVGAYQPLYGGGFNDAFVTKLSPDGSTKLFSTYLGGSDQDSARDVEIGPGPTVYVCGWTRSTDFPTVTPFQSTNAGFIDVFACKLSLDGSTLINSTYLGGSSSDVGSDLAVDVLGTVTIAGDTFSPDYPTVNAFQAVKGSANDVLVTKLLLDGTAPVFSTFLGGNGADLGHGVAVDAAGNVHVTGNTASSDFPLMNPIDGVFNGPNEAFATKLTSDGSALVYSTYFGGNGINRASAITVDAAGDAYLTGGGATVGSGMWVRKLPPDGLSTLYVVSFSGNSTDTSSDIAVDALGNTYVVGSTESTDFPTVNPTQPTYGGGGDGFILQLAPDGSLGSFSTYVGGSASDSLGSVALDGSGNLYVGGGTRSSNFPTVNPQQASLSGITDGIVSRYDISVAELVLTVADCQDDFDGSAGYQIAIELSMESLTSDVSGFQAFVDYDMGSFAYRGDLSSYTGTPFPQHISPIAQGDDGRLELDGSDSFGGSGTDQDGLLATLVFDVTLAAPCSPPSAIGFEVGGTFPSELSFDGSPLETLLVDLMPYTLDDTPPVLAPCPADIVQPADASSAGGCAGAVVTFTDPLATDDCDPVPVVVCTPPSGSFFATGMTTVTCTATDACGNVSMCTFEVQVTPTNEVDVIVELVGVNQPTMRCIHFQTTDSCAVIADQTLPFVDHDGDDPNMNGLVDATEGGSNTPSTPVRASDTISVVCGPYTSLCAKDEQHTRWAATPAVLDGSGASYVTLGVISLEGGDTDNDGDVDINDVTLLLTQFGGGAVAGGCPWNGMRDADFSDNGAVGSEDYAFLTANWLTLSACPCILPVTGGPQPARKLWRRADDDLGRAADLNHDGVVDAEDVAVLERRYRLSGELSRKMRATR